MDVLVTGRRCSITDEFREKVSERITSIERLQDRVIRVEVQVSLEPHAKQPDQATRCEITIQGRGPVIRAVGTADDKNLAFERALEKLKSQLRKAADRRKVHRGLRIGQSLSGADTQSILIEPPANLPGPDTHSMAGVEVTGDGPLVVREKNFDAVPLTLAQALDEMELVGHDFFLYVDAETRQPSVVYRRKAYDYGVIHLALAAQA